MSEYDALRRVLSDRPVAFHPAMARLLGGITEALLFQQLAYWSDKGSDPDGWIFKTQVELEDETALTRGQQERARATLRRLGILEEIKRGVPAKLYYRIAWAAVYEMMGITQDAQNAQPRMRETATLARAKRAPQAAQNEQSSIGTKMTAKSTQRNEDLHSIESDPEPRLGEVSAEEWAAYSEQKVAGWQATRSQARRLEGRGG